MKIGVFDSGVGGLSVASAVKAALPDSEVMFVNDQQNVPYGSKSPDVLRGLVKPIFQDMVSRGCEVIVVACNTVTTTLIGTLRSQVSVPLIGMEPMVKPAAEKSKSKIVAVCATPTTLASDRYQWLKATYAQGIEVLEPDCSDWSSMIESNDLDHHKVRERIVEVCDMGADVIVLGCTHYHWIEQDIQAIADEYHATVIQPEQAVIGQLKRVMSELPVRAD